MGLFIVVLCLYPIILKEWKAADKKIKSFSKDQINYPTMVIDANHNTIAYLPGKKRIYVSIDDIKNHTIEAFLAIEDGNFYNHRGISLRGIIRAAIANFQEGKIIQGGSTITQQTARAFFLSNEQSYTRKFKELIYAIVLEKKLDKRQILEIYLNQVYFGKGAYGIGAAAKIYFNVPAPNLSIKQSAYLAGLIKAPSRLSRDINSSRKRQRYVLYRMYKLGFISKIAYRYAKKSNLKLRSNNNLINSIAPYFVDALQYELSYFLDSNSSRSGMEVYSSFDSNLQDKLSHAIHSKFHTLALSHYSMKKVYQHAQVAGIIYNSFRSEIVALQGGMDYSISQFNRALFTARPMNQIVIPLLKLVIYKKKYLEDNKNTNVDAGMEISHWLLSQQDSHVDPHTLFDQKKQYKYKYK